MRNYFKCSRYINPWPLDLKIKDSLDEDTFLSINVAIDDLPNIKDYINDYINEFIDPLREYLSTEEGLKKRIR